MRVNYLLNRKKPKLPHKVRGVSNGCNFVYRRVLLGIARQKFKKTVDVVSQELNSVSDRFDRDISVFVLAIRIDNQQQQPARNRTPNFEKFDRKIVFKDRQILLSRKRCHSLFRCNPAHEAYMFRGNALVMQLQLGFIKNSPVVFQKVLSI